MVVQTDKGLGPGAIEPREYIQYTTRDHIGYKRKRNLGSSALQNVRRRLFNAREMSQAGGVHFDRT